MLKVRWGGQLSSERLVAWCQCRQIASHQSGDVGRGIVKEPSEFVNMNANEIKKKLKEHELGEIRREDKDIDWKEKDVTFLRPRSDLMRELLVQLNRDAEQSKSDDEYNE